MTVRTPIVLNDTNDRYIALPNGDTVQGGAPSFANTRCVDPTKGNDINNGTSWETPWQTMAKAAASTPQATCVQVAPGTLSEDWTWTTPNCDIVGVASRSGIVNMTGTVTINLALGTASLRLEKLSILGNLITAGAGRVFTQNCIVNNWVKTGSGYNQDLNSDIITVSIISGASGQMVLSNGNYGDVANGGTGATLAVVHPTSMTITHPIAHTAGVLLLDTATIVNSMGGSGLTSATGTTVFLRNATFINPSQLPSPITINGSYSFSGLVSGAVTYGGSAVQLPFNVYTDNIVSNTMNSLTGYTGRTAALGSGKIGQVITATVNNLSSIPNSDTPSIVPGCNVVLTPGIWMVTGFVKIIPSAVLLSWNIGFDTVANLSMNAEFNVDPEGKIYALQTNTGPNYFVLSGGDTINMLAAITYQSASAIDFSAKILAVRIG